MIAEKIKVTGALQIALNGEVVQEVPNLVVTSGKNWIAGKLYAAGSPGSDMSHMALGTGTTAADAANTALESELARVALTGTTVSTNTIQYSATFPAGTGTGAITEAGVLNAGVAGTLLCRTVFAVVNKGATDAMTITWTITVS